MNDKARWLPEDRCHWVEDEDGYFDSTCDNRYDFLSGGPADNHFHYCPYCGQKLVEVRFHGDAQRALYTEEKT